MIPWGRPHLKFVGANLGDCFLGNVGRKTTKTVKRESCYLSYKVGKEPYWRCCSLWYRWFRRLDSAYSVFSVQDPETSHSLPDMGNVHNYSRSKRWEQRGLRRHRGLEQGWASPYVCRVRSIACRMTCCSRVSTHVLYNKSWDGLYSVSSFTVFYF